jgi:D-galactose 1-dehydrogenase
MTVRKIALVGIGKIARERHIPAIANNPDFELAATASRKAEIENVDTFSNLRSLLRARPDIDCVSLCTPPQVRYADARLALEAGCHVMLEKPPGATLSEVHDLIALAEGRGLTLFATWHSRHAAGVASARDWLTDKRIRRVEVNWKEDVRRWHPGQEWIWHPGGFGVFDPGINAFSVLTAIFPRVLHLTHADLLFPENRETPIAALLEFREPGGAEVSAAFDWRQEGPQIWEIRVVTETGDAVLSEGGARFTVDGQARATGPQREYAGLYARFAELLNTASSETDLAPMRHVADAFTIGRRIDVEKFDW